MSYYAVTENTVARYTGKLVDETGAGIAAINITSLTLTLVDDATGTIINSRSNQDVNNANGVTVDSSGNLVWTIGALDNAMVGNLEYESHTATFKWGWAANTKTGYKEICLQVKNLRKAP